MRKVRILLSTAVMLLVLSLCGCGKKVVTYTTEDYISVSVSGVNGEGRLSVQSGSDEFFQRVNNDVFEGKASEIDLASMTVNIAAYADYNVSSSENLSNGDTVTITMTADNESLRELGLEFALDEYVYTVSGLAEPQELDVWTGLDVTFTGISEKGEAEVIYNGTDEFVKQHVRYKMNNSYGSPYNLANDDTITVQAECSQSDLDEGFYVISEPEREFTVSGLPYYAENFDGFDVSEFEAELLAEAEERADKSTWGKAYSDQSYLYGFQLNIDGEGRSSQVWQVNGKYTLTPVKKILYKKNATDDYMNYESNSYTIFYKITFPYNYVQKRGYAESSYDPNETFELTLYMESHITDMVIDEELMKSENTKIGGKLYSADVINNYMGLSLEEIISVYEKEHSYSEWKKTEIK